MEILTLKQARAQMLFNKWNQEKNNVVILDTETTGLYDSEICEVSVIDLDGNVIFDSLVKPKNPIPREVKAIHGISDEMVADKPSWPETWESLYPLIKDKIVLIYNSEFDVRLMAESFYPYYPENAEEIKQVEGLKTACVMKTYAALVGSGKWLKLTQAAGRQIAHRSLDDCKATLEVIRKSYNPDFTETTFQRLENWHELESISKRIRYLSYRIKELSEEQVGLVKRQKELQVRLFGFEFEDEKEVAASYHDDPFDVDNDQRFDISDDDLPF